MPSWFFAFIFKFKGQGTMNVQSFIFVGTKSRDFANKDIFVNILIPGLHRHTIVRRIEHIVFIFADI